MSEIEIDFGDVKNILLNSIKNIDIFMCTVVNIIN